MSAERFTPGPWKAVKAPHGPIDIIDSRDRDIVTVFGSVSDPARQQANARLIAAAPDLLASVKDALSMLKTVEVIDGQDGDPWSKAMARMEAAIAKAEGR